MRRRVFAAVIGAWLAISAGSSTSAHVTVVSPYTFTQHVLPILRERCGVCHGEDTPGRPLLDLAQAKQSAVEIGRSVMVGRMPPWSAEAGAAGFKGQQTLTPREVDILMTWTAGGTPEHPETAGLSTPHVDAAVEPSLAAATPMPDLVLHMPRPFVFDAATPTAVHEEVFEAKAARGRAIRAVDIRPGNPSIVQRAEVAIRTRQGDRTIALWTPGDRPQPLESKAAYPVPRGASIVLNVHYMRPPAGETAARSDRSEVGLFFAPTGNAPNPRDLVIEAAGVFPINEPRVVRRPIAKTMHAVALRPISGPVDAMVVLDMVTGDGHRQLLARLQLRAKWPRRYIFVTPVTLLAGAHIEARVSRRDPFVWSALTGDEAIPADEAPLRIAIETID